MRVFLAALAALALLSSTANADVVEEVLGCKGNPCIVTYSPGGTIKMFEEAAEAIRNGARELVVIEGPCMSACTILIDMVPEKVCLKPLAKLGFHRGSGPTLKYLNEMPLYWYTVWERFDISYSPKVQEWINSQGGLPKDGTFIYMTTSAARTIWKTCSSQQVFQAHGLY